jgi:hypothetical protein
MAIRANPAEGKAVRACSWCGFAWNGYQWVRVDYAELPRETTHAICEECYERVIGHPMEYEFFDPRMECLGG